MNSFEHAFTIIAKEVITNASWCVAETNFYTFRDSRLIPQSIFVLHSWLSFLWGLMFFPDSKRRAILLKDTAQQKISPDDLACFLSRSFPVAQTNHTSMSSTPLRERERERKRERGRRFATPSERVQRRRQPPKDQTRLGRTLKHPRIQAARPKVQTIPSAAAHLKRCVSPADQQTLRTAAQCARYSEKHDPGRGAGYLKSRSLLKARA